MNVEAKGLDYRALNEAIRAAGPACRINGCLGQRFIGAGMRGRQVEIHGIPGNALGAYLGGGSITVCGNAQDAVGEILRLTEGSLAPVTCLEGEENTCPRAGHCHTLPMWEKLDSLINGYLDSVSLADLLRQTDGSSL